MSVTEARDNFPALVRRVAEQDESVVVTSHNQPRVVLLRWETYQAQQRLQAEGAQHHVRRLVTEMEQVAAGLSEGFSPGSLELVQGLQELAMLAHDLWQSCRLLDAPRRHLASLVADSLLNLREGGGELTQRQLAQLLAILPHFHQTHLTNEVVAAADRALAEAGLPSVFPIGDDFTHQLSATLEPRT
jgi:prevent-host-death family protein